jgi:hypothetical protein
MLAKWKVADRMSGRSRTSTDLELVRGLRFVAEADRQLPWKRASLAHRNVQRASDKWHECPLSDDRDEHDDEHDPVHALGPGDFLRRGGRASR